MTSELGELVTADLRKAWPHEAHDFTPWLAENLDRLSAVIGLVKQALCRRPHYSPSDIVRPPMTAWAYPTQARTSSASNPG